MFSQRADAAVITWDGGAGDGNWLSCTNWSTNGCPGTADIATFNSTATGNVAINGAISVAGIDVQSTWSGVLTQASGSSNTITVGASNFVFAAVSSTFTGGNANVNHTGAFTFSGSGSTYNASSATTSFTGTSTVSNGTFNGGAGTLTYSGTFTISGGTYNATSGTGSYAGGWNHSGGATFNHNNGTVNINGGSASLDVVPSGTETFYKVVLNKTTANAFSVSSGDTMVVESTLLLIDGNLNAGTTEVKGDVIASSTFDGATTSMRFAGASSQTFDLTGVTDKWNGTINVAGSSTVTMASNLTLDANVALTVSSGTFDLSTYSFVQTVGVNLNGGTLNATNASTFDLDGTLTLAGGSFNAPSGTGTFAGGWTRTSSSGTFTHNNGVIVFDGGGNATLDVPTSFTEDFYNLTMNKTGGSNIAIPAGDTIEVLNDLMILDGALNGGTTEVTGDVTNNTNGEGGSTSLRFVGTQPQIFDLVGGTDEWNGIVTIANTGSGSVTMASDIILNANTSFTLTSGTFNMAGYNFYNTAAVSSNGGTFNSGSGTFETDGLFTIAGGTFNATTSTGTFSGGWTHTAGGVFNHNNGVTVFDGGSQTLNVASTENYHHLVISKIHTGSLTISSGDTMVAEGNLTLTDGSLATGTIEAKGNVTSGANWDGGSATIKFSGTTAQVWDLTGGTDKWNGAVNIAGSGSGSVTMASNLTLDANVAFTMTSGTFNLNGFNLIQTSTLTHTNGTFNGGSGTIDIDGAFALNGGTHTATSGTGTFGAGWTRTAGTFNHNNGTIVVDGGSATLDPEGAANFYNFVLSKNDGNTLTVASNEVLLVENNLTLINGLLNSTGGRTEVKGNFTVTGFDGGTSVFRFSGSADQIFNLSGGTGGINTDIVVLKDAGKVTLASDLVMDGTGQDLTISSGTFDLAGNNFTFNGASSPVFSVASGATLQMQGGETLTLSAGNPVLAHGSNVTYNGGSSYTIKNFTYSNIAVNNASGVFSLGSAETINNLSINAGTFSLAGQTFSATGSFSNDGTLRLQGAETLSITMDNDSGLTEYVGNADTNANPYVIKDLSYYNLKINFSDSADNASHADGSLDVNGAFTMAGGSFSAPSSMTVAGDFSLTGGTFTHNSGTVTLDGTSQTIAGAVIFNNLTKNVSSAATLTFPASATVTVVGTLDLKGVSGQRLSIRSSVNNTQASLDAQGTKSVEYLDVKDSNAVTGISCLTGCLDSTGNTNWYFSTSVLLTESSGATAVTEGGATDTYTLVLTAPPSNNVTVSISNGAQTSTSTGTVIFTTGNWNVAQTITVSAVDDSSAEGGHTGTITHSSASSDSNYNGISISNVVANISDNDSAGITVGAISGNTSEAGSGATFTVVLTSQPSANVSIGVSSNDTSEGTVSPATLTFTNLNWNQAQTVSVSGVDDDIDDGNIAYSIILAAAVSADSSFNGSNPADVSVTNADNDSAGVLFSESALAMTEGSADTYTIVLLSEPTSDVTIAIGTDAQTSASATGAVFTSLDWDTPQTITITAVDDSTVEGAHTGEITHSASGDAVYTVLSLNSLAYTITDNDSAGSGGDDPVYGGGGGGGGGGSGAGSGSDSGGSSGESPSDGGEDGGEPVDESDHPFIDTIGHWAEPAILNLFGRDIVKGRAPGIFAPNDNITRAEFIKIVILNAGYDIAEFSGAEFTDVSERDWFYDYVSFAQFSGFIRGYDDGTFRPNAPINRAEAVLIIMRISEDGITSYKEEDVKFYDVPVSTWYTYAVVNASKKGIIQGYTDGSFKPDNNMTRAEMAVVAKRTFDVYFD